MNGAEIVLKTAIGAGVDVCFTNPGTTELPMVAAFDAIKGIRPVLGLFEGVCSGAADGYGRMADKPAMTLFHLGPGLGNAVANLHNARRARTPVFNVIGDHAAWHIDADAPLTMNIEALSATVSAWTRTARSANTLSQDTADALTAAAWGVSATLILPQDVQWSEAISPQIAPVTAGPEPIDTARIETVAARLRLKKKNVLILGGNGLREKGLKAAARISDATGCSLQSETFPAHMERGKGLPALARLPYTPEFAFKQLAEYENIVLVGAREPVAFFGYRGGRSRLVEDNSKIIALTEYDPATVLENLADALDAPPYTAMERRSDPTALPGGSLNAKKLSTVLAALQPEGAIVVDESITSAAGYYKHTATAPRFSLLTLTGGAIGMGLPCAAGAALACPDRPVIVFQADGSAMYTVQALWTHAREGLDVTTIICANRSYNILGAEFKRAEDQDPQKWAGSLMDLSRPDIDWVSVSRGLGVPACAVDTAEDLAKALRKAFAKPGPNLIQANL